MADELPEFYVDTFRTTVGAYGVALTFALAPAHPNPGQTEASRDVVRLRMSLEHAKVMAMIVRRQLKRYEEELGVQINLPRPVLNQLGLSSEDW